MVRCRFVLCAVLTDSRTTSLAGTDAIHSELNTHSDPGTPVMCALLVTCAAPRLYALCFMYISTTRATARALNKAFYKLVPPAILTPGARLLHLVSTYLYLQSVYCPPVTRDSITVSRQGVKRWHIATQDTTPQWSTAPVE